MSEELTRSLIAGCSVDPRTYLFGLFRPIWQMVHGDRDIETFVAFQRIRNKMDLRAIDLRLDAR